MFCCFLNKKFVEICYGKNWLYLRSLSVNLIKRFEMAIDCLNFKSLSLKKSFRPKKVFQFSDYNTHERKSSRMFFICNFMCSLENPQELLFFCHKWADRLTWWCWVLPRALRVWHKMRKIFSCVINSWDCLVNKRFFKERWKRFCDLVGKGRIFWMFLNHIQKSCKVLK